MSKLFLTLFLVLIVGIAGLFSLFVYPSDIGNNVVSVIIRSGDTFESVADTLDRHGVVRSKLLLKLVARWMKLDRTLALGRYDFTGRNSLADILHKLDRAEFVRIKLTIYEGAPIWKTASILNAKLEIDSATIMNLNSDSLFLASLNLPYLEGYLFPETYLIPWGASLDDVIREMVSMHHARTDSMQFDRIPNNLSRSQLIVLASIIEAEAFAPEEQPLISSVYHNRLRRRMKLQADPTVIYGLGGLDRPLNKRDLKTDTQYNTYARYGLPPTPINSPGLAAIRAALNPADTDYLYFVADGTGGHVFSRTNAEHNRARDRIRRSQSGR